MSEFIKAFGQSLPGSFVKLSLSGYRGGEADLKKIDIRKIIVKGAEKLSFTYHYKTRDIVKNYDTQEATAKLKTFLPDFRNGILFTTAFDLHLENGKTKKRPATHTETPPTGHDQKKNRQVDAARPYLHALGITDAKGHVLKTAQDKYRQIDKYIEILGGLLKDRDIKTIADMGSGKGYLTFALYDHLSDKNVKVTGVEARPDLVKLCNKIAKDSGFTNLHFTEGTIENYDASGTDVLIALHACDTATDDAILKGIKAGAEVIVAAPCCHKQIRREMEKSKKKNELSSLTRHGIFLERQAEMVTDTLRALYLEYAGYSTKVFEFVAGEHTPKNVMITAVRSSGGRSSETLQKINEIRDFFGISFHPLQV
ncbi:MAG: SAM-dependent methyltransferase, partial [Alphaproteobacteria bacterium]|nr:SAM-dependent methyltransferase [Alphaproteobacteria bacterium]